jgi:hypothetical protein
MFHNGLQDEILVSLILVLIMGTISSGSQMKGSYQVLGENTNLSVMNQNTLNGFVGR